MYFYIVYSKDVDRYYIGVTSSLDQRLQFHNHKRSSKGFSKIAKDWQYVLTYQCANKSQALAVEKFVKQQKSRKFNER